MSFGTRWPRRAGRLVQCMFACTVMAALLGGCGSEAAVGPDAKVVDTVAIDTPMATTSPLVSDEPASGPTPLSLADPAVPTTTASTTPVPTSAPTSAPTTVPTVTASADPPPPADPPATAVLPATAVPTVAGSQTVLVANGGEVFTLNCARCHAENGLGTAQYSATLIGVGRQYSSQGMIAELTSGHPVTFGFADRLSADEIASVVAYVKATFP